MVPRPIRFTQHTTRQRPLDFVRLASGWSGTGTASGVSNDVRIRRWGRIYFEVSTIRVEIPHGIYTIHASNWRLPYPG